MRNLVYVVGGQEITSYTKARELQPTGQLQTKLVEAKEEVKADPKKIARWRKCFAKQRAKRVG